MQAGCRIAELAEALRQHGLTLVNYASIREQAVGGFVQVRGLRLALSREPQRLRQSDTGMVQS